MLSSARLSLVLVCIALATPIPRAAASGASYNLKDNYTGSNFLSKFTFEAIADPTNGRVNYVNQSVALAQNLTYASGNTIVLSADSKTTFSSNGPGRNSVRVKSVNTYTTHVAIFDVRHMPQGCGTWPAAWEVKESNWPNSGEVDVIEGVNDVAPNLSSLHTSNSCQMPASRNMTGTAQSNDCAVADNGNTGCGVSTNKANSYGPAFNAAGGGYYAVERTSNYIQVFFWSRGDSSVPAEVTNGASTINTAKWGLPVALFPSTSSCSIPAHFGAHNIIINLTFCGDYAGVPSVFNGAGCPGTCTDYVNNNPSAFVNAYWNFAGIRVYT